MSVKEADEGLNKFGVWRRSYACPVWVLTSHVIQARTTKEAQAKLKRKFANAGFSNMALAAIPAGDYPA